MSLATYAAAFSHTGPCPTSEVVQVTGREGDPGLFCRSCRRVWFPPGLAEVLRDPDADESESHAVERAHRSVERLIRNAAWLDSHEQRQVARRGDGWPRHKARKRNRGKRRLARERNAA